MKKWNIVGMAAAVGIAAITFHAYAADKLKVGFIYVGPIGDLGWSYQHDLGRKVMEKELGDKVESTYLENVPEGADAERPIEQLARTGHKLIFTTSFGFMDATLKVANKYPNVFFEHATGFKRAKNMSTYAARFYEGRYIQGQIAAKMSKSGIVGYIVSFPIPEVISNINATMLGAQSVRPDIKFKIVWVNSWFDPGKEADAAKTLIDQGADVLTQDTDYWGGYYTKRAQAALDGKWQSEDTWGGLDSGMVVMSPYTNMPDDVKQMAMKTEADIKSGALHPFKCPITDQDGKTVECKGGSHLDPGQILSMNWYVKGIDDKIPGK